MNWIDQVNALVAAKESVMLVTVAGIRGSSPREVGAKMLVTQHVSLGSIGGGCLEYECIAHARLALANSRSMDLRRFPLGPSLGQCCGGVVDVYFDRIHESCDWLNALSDSFTSGVLLITHVTTHEKQVIHNATAFSAIPNRVIEDHFERRCGGRYKDWLVEFVGPPTFCVSVFGAGHVGKCLVDVLATLSCQIRWVDNRMGVLPTRDDDVVSIQTHNPLEAVTDAPAGSYFVVLTHDHQLDFALCDAILQRADAQFVGVIGSATKRRRFEMRFNAMGVAPSVVEQLVCPIGLSELTGKAPEEIAVSVAADLLRRRDAQNVNLLAPTHTSVAAVGG